MCSSDLNESAAADLLVQVGSALTHLHGTGIAHRDIKPGNIVFSDNSKTIVRLVDFGFASVFRTDGGSTRKLKTMCGSPCYMAPELHRGVAYLGPPVDVWAFGATAYELLHNKPAFRAESHAQLHVRIIKCSHEKFAASLSGRIRNIVKRVFTPDATERPTAEAITRMIRATFDLGDSDDDCVRTPRIRDFL